jgi:hypothetical protein
MTRFDQMAVIDSFLQPFALPNSLHEKILADFDTWHYPYVCNVGSIFPEHPANGRLTDHYTIRTFSIPDRLHSFASRMGHVIIWNGVRVYRYPQYDYRKLKVGLAGIDSFSCLDTREYLLSGQAMQMMDALPQIFCLRDQTIEEVRLSETAKDFLRSLQVTNLYGFACINEKIYFGTWGKPSNARLMCGEIQDSILYNLRDITPSEIVAQGYDDLFVRAQGDGWLQIGGKLGVNTLDPAVYYFHVILRQLTKLPIVVTSEDEQCLLDKMSQLGHHLYFHQVYKIDTGYHAVVLAGHLGALFHIMQDNGIVMAQYYLALPNDNCPFAEYPWNHLLKHPASPNVYVPDNNGVIHRFSYEAKNNILYVLKFKLPIHGEISALTATAFGLYVAVTCNHANYVLKLTHDFTCFIIYESKDDDTPITALFEHSDNLVIALTGSRFFPYYLFARYCHHLDKREKSSESEIILIKTNNLSQDLYLGNAQERARQKHLIAAKISVNPQYQFFLHLAAMELEDGNYSQAIAWAQQAIEGEATALYPYKILGLAFMHTGKFQEARDTLQFFLDQEPHDTECKEAFTYCTARIEANPHSSTDNSIQS